MSDPTFAPPTRHEGFVPSLLGIEQVRAQLEAQPWWQATDDQVKETVLALPTSSPKVGERAPDENCIGYLRHLAQRPCEGGGVRLRRLLEVLVPKCRPIFGIFTQFEVQGIDDPTKVFAYQYVSWRHGPDCGAKGIVLVEGHEGISHLIVLTGFSFAVGANTFDSVGGFAGIDEAGIEKMMARYKTELAEELGVPDLKIKQVHNLGRIHPDRGLSNECPAIFAGVVDASQASRIVQGTSFNPDPFEMRAGPLVVPVENLWGPQGLIEVSTDAFFHAAVLRAMNRGLLPTPSL